MKEQNNPTNENIISSIPAEELADNEYIGKNGIICTFPAEISLEEHAYPSPGALDDHERDTYNLAGSLNRETDNEHTKNPNYANSKKFQY